MSTDRTLLLGQLELARDFLYAAEVADDPQVLERKNALVERALSFVERRIVRQGAESDIRQACEELRARSRAIRALRTCPDGRDHITKHMLMLSTYLGHSNAALTYWYLEAVPEGYILVLYNHDVPGVVGAVGTLLGKKNINIAAMELGREKVGGMAISLFHVDDTIPKETLDELRQLPNIVSVVLVKL